MLQFFIRTVKKLLSTVVFIFENLWKHTVQKYVLKQCLRLLPHVSRAHRTFSCSIISYTFEMWHQMKWKSWKNKKIIIKNFDTIFSTFFSSQVVTKVVLIRFLQQKNEKLFLDIKTFKTEKCWKFSIFFFPDRVRGAVVKRIRIHNAEPIVLVVFNTKSARYLVLFAGKSTR